MSRQLVIISDGTNNSPEVNQFPTNPQLLRRFLAEGEKKDSTRGEGWEVHSAPHRIVYYDRGLGAAAKDGGFLPTMQDYLAAVTACGISQNIRQAYEFLVENYRDGDTVHFFGFSRGSFTMLVLVDLLDFVGLPKRNQDIDEALELGILSSLKQEYRTRLRTVFRMGPPPTNMLKANEFKAQKSQANFKIHFLGLFDVVPGELPLPEFVPSVSDGNIDIHKVALHSDVLSPIVLVARHALALDEHRTTFLPQKWRPNGKTNSKQMWFTGSHSDVGGSYKESGLANLAMEWMWDELVKVGGFALTKFDVDRFQDWKAGNEKAEIVIHHEPLTKYQYREVGEFEDEDIHETAREWFNNKVLKDGRALIFSPVKEPMYKRWVESNYSLSEYRPGNLIKYLSGGMKGVSPMRSKL